MKVSVEVLPRGGVTQVELPERTTGMDLLEHLRLHPDSYVLFRGDSPIPIDEPLRPGEDLKVILVVSGGTAEAY